MAVTAVAQKVEGVTRGWQRTYQTRLLFTDRVIILAAVLLAQLLRFGTSSTDLQVRPDDLLTFDVSYTLLSLGIALLWMCALGVVNATGTSVTGTGFTEYKRVADATVWTFGVLAIGALLLRVDIARGYLMVAFPLGLLALLLSRWLWRKWLHAGRRRGEYLHRTIVVGEYVKVAHVASEVAREPYAGFQLVGAVTDVTGTECEGMSDCGTLGRLYRPLPGSIDPILNAVEHGVADTLILTTTNSLSPYELRRLGWAMEERGIDLIVAPALTDIAGPRISSRPVAGLPLIHIAFPEFSGQKYWLKRAFDVIGAALLLLLLSPVLIVIALLVKSDGGPVFFRQERVGIDGTTFRMLKFRSMVVNAESKLGALMASSDGNGVLFKMKDDPRITRHGRWLRRYSLDELPQLLNVLKGDMSLVGPRPPLPKEVELYDDGAHRRFMVKPGITGLWQVSGRSNLSWDDSIRLDLYYVENWSLIGDMILMFKTVRAVLRSEGAYQGPGEVVEGGCG